jgi:hypothetical protein
MLTFSRCEDINFVVRSSTLSIAHFLRGRSMSRGHIGFALLLSTSPTPTGEIAKELLSLSALPDRAASGSCRLFTDTLVVKLISSQNFP